MVSNLKSKSFLSTTLHLLTRFAIIFASKRSLARLLSTLLCCIIVVIRPFSVLGGSFAFLVLAAKELVFSVQSSLAQQLELTILNTLGAVLGIAVSTLAKFISIQSPVDSAGSRVTCAIFLVLISFFAGLIKSRLPRLQLSTRISCFVSVWILTTDIGIPSRLLTSSGNFLWVTLSAAIICLVSLLAVMTVVRWTSTNFERDIASTFIVIYQCLQMGLTLAFPHPSDPSVDKNEYIRLKDDLLRRSINLNENYSQAAFELRIGRLSLRSIRPLIGIVEHLRRELAWGMPIRKPVNASRHGTYRFHRDPVNSPLQSPPLPEESKFTSSLEHSAQALGNALLECTNAVERTITLAFHQAEPPVQLFSWTPSSPVLPNATPSLRRKSGWTCSQLNVIRNAEATLRRTRDDAREQLRLVFNDIDMQQRDENADPHVPKDALNCSLAMIALLQMAQEARVALQVAQRFASQYEDSRPRLWYPHFSLAWLGIPPGPFITDDPVAQLTIWNAPSNDTLNAADTNYAAPEWKQGLREHVHRIDVRRSALSAARMNLPAKSNSITKRREVWWGNNISRWIDHAWSNKRSLKLRMKLWRFIKAVRHSSHLRHAAKNACGVALLTFPAFMPANSDGRKWYAKVHGQWMTISYLWVLETNTGATWRAGYLRILGTICGVIYGYITWLICRANPYGLVVMVTAADIPITWLITQNNLGPLAVPASVAIPPIVFSQYISPASSGSVSDLAFLRAGMISAGMVAALIMNSLVFPRHCRVYFLSDTSRTLGLLTDLYLTLSHNILQDRNSFTRDDRRKTLKLELEIRNALSRLSALIITMHNEIGLLPKPLRHYRRVMTALQNMLDVMTGLRKIRENIPRKITVADVFKERREFMSCVCVTLFACQHAFKAREPLPQFLPSARHAFDILEKHVQERIRQVRDEDPHAMGLSLVYAFAEQEVLRNMVDTLETLLELTGSLFGTSAWLTLDTRWSRTTLHEEGDHGWYSTFKWEES